MDILLGITLTSVGFTLYIIIIATTIQSEVRRSTIDNITPTSRDTIASCDKIIHWSYAFKTPRFNNKTKYMQAYPYASSE